MSRIASTVAVLGLTLGVSMTAAAPSALADDDEAIKYRKNVMSVVGGHMQSMAAIIQGRAGDAAHVEVHAEGLARIFTVAPEAFRPQTRADARERTRARPEIWANWSDFEAKMHRARDEAAKLPELASAGDMQALGRQVQALGQACRACHDDYRSP